MVARPLINKTAKELSEAVERNQDSRAELELLIRELGHRSTPSARQAAKELSDKVQEEAKKQGWTMSAEQAEKTISGWLGPKKLGSRQPAKVLPLPANGLDQ